MHFAPLSACCLALRALARTCALRNSGTGQFQLCRGCFLSIPCEPSRAWIVVGFAAQEDLQLGLVSSGPLHHPILLCHSAQFGRISTMIEGALVVARAPLESMLLRLDMQPCSKSCVRDSCQADVNVNLITTGSDIICLPWLRLC